MSKRVLLLATGTVWIAFWFWAFSFVYSPSYFLYHRHTRIPLLAVSLACACACALPASATAQCRAVAKTGRSPLGALLRHGVAGIIALAGPFALTSVFARSAGPWHLEADEAMGAGIDNAILLLMAVSSLVALGVAIRARKLRRRSARRRSAGRARPL